MKQPQILVGTVLLGALCLPALAQQKPAADAAVVTAKEPGNVATVNADPEVRNFDQIKVGDQVIVQYLEALSLTLKKDGKELRAMTDTTDAARAAAGGKPAAAAARRVEVTADVIAVDAKKQLVTLRGPKQVVELKMLDPEQLKLIKVGDQIQAVFRETVALPVEPAAPAKK